MITDQKFSITTQAHSNKRDLSVTSRGVGKNINYDGQIRNTAPPIDISKLLQLIAERYQGRAKKYS